MNGIRKYRGQKGIPQQEIANHLNTSRQRISFLETGKRKILPSEAEKIAEILGCTVFQLYGEDLFYYAPKTDVQKLQVIEFLIDELQDPGLKNEYQKRFKGN